MKFKLGGPDPVMMKPKHCFERAPHGPFTVTQTKNSITAVTATGREVVVAANLVSFHKEIEHELVEGIDVTIDGVRVGQLFQKHHGYWRKDRGLSFVPVDTNRFPTKPFFRLRRSVKVVCENDTGQLIGPPWFVPLGGGRLNVAEGVSGEMLLVYVAVASGLLNAMKL